MTAASTPTNGATSFPLGRAPINGPYRVSHPFHTCLHKIQSHFPSEYAHSYYINRANPLDRATPRAYSFPLRRRHSSPIFFLPCYCHTHLSSAISQQPSPPHKPFPDVAYDGHTKRMLWERVCGYSKWAEEDTIHKDELASTRSA